MRIVRQQIVIECTRAEAIDTLTSEGKRYIREERLDKARIRARAVNVLEEGHDQVEVERFIYQITDTDQNPASA